MQGLSAEDIAGVRVAHLQSLVSFKMQFNAIKGHLQLKSGASIIDLKACTTTFRL